MLSYLIALIVVLAIWFLFCLVYINRLQRKIDSRCDELRRQISEGKGDE